MTLMCTLLPVAVNMARVMAVTRRVEVLARKAIMDQKWESRFKNSNSCTFRRRRSQSSNMKLP
jgi:hypothetical protein